MNINECGCRPYGWLGLDGDRCICVIPRHRQNLVFVFLLTEVFLIDTGVTFVVQNKGDHDVADQEDCHQSNYWLHHANYQCHTLNWEKIV